MRETTPKISPGEHIDAEVKEPAAGDAAAEHPVIAEKESAACADKPSTAADVESEAVLGDCAGTAQAAAQAPAEPEEAAAAEPEEVGEGAGAPAPEPSMAWHRFLTGFYLYLAAAYHLLQAAWMLRGGQYFAAEIRDRVYEGLPGMRMLDWGLALAAAVAALLCIAAAIQLRRRRSAGPKLLRAAYLLLIAGQLAFAAGRYFIAGLTPLSVATVGPLLFYLALLLVNGSYYRRRRSAFARRS